MRIPLEQQPPEHILDAIEDTSDKLAVQEKRASDAKTSLTALEAASALSYRDAGMAMNEAEKRVRKRDDWVEAYTQCQHEQIEFHKLKRDYERALIAAELWRSVQANLRKI